MVFFVVSCFVVAFVLAVAILERFVDEEEIGEQRAQVNRRVQVVDDRGADRSLGDDETHCGLRIGRVPLNDFDERVERRRVGAEVPHAGRQRVEQTAEGLVAAQQVGARLIAGSACVIRGETLRGVRQEELVRLFNGVALRSKRGERCVGLRCVRAQIQISVISVSLNLKSEI
jgi:hypothetical protein